MAGNYAAGTGVTPQGSQAEIQHTLERFECDQVAIVTSRTGGAAVLFEKHGRRVRFSLELPSRSDSRFRYTPGRQLQRSGESAQREWEQACREVWRALAVGIKAKLAMIEAGITTFEDEFFAHTLLPNGQTVSEAAGPAVAKALATNTMPELLPGMGS